MPSAGYEILVFDVWETDLPKHREFVHVIVSSVYSLDVQNCISEIPIYTHVYFKASSSINIYAKIHMKYTVKQTNKIPKSPNW